jgi:hypothetical protein
MSGGNALDDFPLIKLVLVYPGMCAKCGQRWGDHLSEQTRKRAGHGCGFEALPGELERPRYEEFEKDGAGGWRPVAVPPVQ